MTRIKRKIKIKTRSPEKNDDLTVYLIDRE
jgi:hypothetical protein